MGKAARRAWRRTFVILHGPLSAKSGKRAGQRGGFKEVKAHRVRPPPARFDFAEEIAKAEFSTRR